MPSKSPLNIVEDAITAALKAEASLSAFTIYRGEETSELTLPSIVVSCENAQLAPDIAQGLGNYLCRVSLGVINNIDDNTETTHRNATQEVMAIVDDVTKIKAAFTTIGDGSCYDTTLTAINYKPGDRAFTTSLEYDVLMVLPPA
jgi:hypothetical protein